MNKSLISIFFFVFLIIPGCSEQKVDASSDKSMKESVQKIRNSLTETKRKKFDEAIRLIALSQINLKDLLAQNATGSSTTEIKMRESLNGKTGEQIIAEADRIRDERKERELKQASEEINELEKKKNNAENAREELKKFQIIRSRFYKENKKHLGRQPIIEISVKNGLEQPISRAYFEGTLASPNRSIPWLKKAFNYSISGGLEPGEEATWSLAPNMFSEWGSTEIPGDAVFTVTVEKVDGPDDKPICAVNKFTANDRERLETLKKKFNLQ